jgi:hypothetical protein
MMQTGRGRRSVKETNGMDLHYLGLLDIAERIRCLTPCRTI